MSALGIFLYGVAVAALVGTALMLVLWGIVNEHRDRHSPEQGKEVFGEDAAAYASPEGERR